MGRFYDYIDTDQSKSVDSSEIITAVKKFALPIITLVLAVVSFLYSRKGRRGNNRTFFKWAALPLAAVAVFLGYKKIKG